MNRKLIVDYIPFEITSEQINESISRLDEWIKKLEDLRHEIMMRKS